MTRKKSPSKKRKKGRKKRSRPKSPKLKNLINLNKKSMKKIYLSLIAVLAVLGLAGFASGYYGGTPKVVVEGDYIEADGEMLGAVSGPDYYDDFRVHGSLNYKEKMVSLANTTGDAYSTTTLTIADSGSTYLISGTGTTITLPAVAQSEGVNFKFMVNGALGVANSIIASAEGDNIEGSLIVAGAVVDCDAEDFINFIQDGENLGDYVEVYSDGSKWYIGDSGALTTSKLTCTDPS